MEVQVPWNELSISQLYQDEVLAPKVHEDESLPFLT